VEAQEALDSVFHLDAAGEPSVNICVAYGTLCNLIQVSILLFVINQLGRNVASMFYFYVLAESRLKNTVLDCLCDACVL